MSARVQALTLREIAADGVCAVEVLRRYGLDVSGTDKRNLADACRDQGLDPRVVADELTSVGQPRGGRLDPACWPLDRLIDYIVDRHHGFVRAALPLVSCKLNVLVDTCAATAKDLSNWAGFPMIRLPVTFSPGWIPRIGPRPTMSMRFGC
jgi:iron-sulfur cluster repair protein YtfE (RIC family)